MYRLQRVGEWISVYCEKRFDLTIEGFNSCSHLPAVVFVEFDGYSGPETPAWEGISPSWVPIIPAVARWENKAGKALTHTQFPQ